MAKSGRLGKLKCMLKRWHSLGRLAPAAGDGGAATSAAVEGGSWQPSSVHGDRDPLGFHAVYVGKSRRRYLISSDVAGHPLFQVLVQRSGRSDDGSAVTFVGCEVVLFEHLLWMIENADPQPESLDELVEFYAC
ncbi:auxin-responsive protein SAUR78-like [Phoenix dactylifera]|uniref:Auxin-responsive protein SAUR78-like n=1 Tax=Phoenix dactylifera TaxID=42345 RepID=A0A8B7BL51_PHODC|nr:auxin-responsive protein SAUR78-like [Phoenix dactylifera]